MRVCFDGLCFASRRTAVDEETQTVSELHDTGGIEGGGGGIGCYTNRICDDNQTSNNIVCTNDPTVSSNKDTVDSSHKIHKHSASATARNKLLSLLSLSNFDRKLFFLRNKMDSHDTQTPPAQQRGGGGGGLHQQQQNNQFSLDLANRNHSNNMVRLAVTLSLSISSFID